MATASTPYTQRPASELAEYLTHVRFDVWKRERSGLEERWTNADNCYRQLADKTWKTPQEGDWRADSYLGAAKRKALAATAMMATHLLRGGAAAFDLKMEPSGSSEEEIEEASAQFQEDMAVGRSEINAHLSATRFDKEMLRLINSGAKYGECWGKAFAVEHTSSRRKRVALEGGPFPQEIADKYARWEKVENTRMRRGAEQISNWEVFCDRTHLGRDNWLQDCAGICHQTSMTAYELRQMIGDPGMIRQAVEDVIEGANDRTSKSQTPETDAIPPPKRFMEWRGANLLSREFWTRVPRKVVKEFQTYLKDAYDEPEDVENYLEDGDEVEVLATVVNDVVVRFLPREGGTRPWYYCPWDDPLDDVGGIGVVEKARDINIAMNGVFNNWQDNVKLAANVMGVYSARYFEGDDMSFYPGKFMPLNENTRDAREAIQQFKIDAMDAPLERLFALLDQLLDDETSMPKAMQGQMGPHSPDTAYQTRKQLEQGAQAISGTIRNYDEGIVEPVATDVWDYVMEDPDVIRGKGPFVVVPLGYSTFRERVEDVQEMMWLLELALGNEEAAMAVEVPQLIEEIARRTDSAATKFVVKPEEYQRRKQERAQAQMEMMQMEAQLQQAQTEKAAADAAASQEKVRQDDARLKLDTAKFVAESAAQRREQALKAKALAQKPATKSA